MSSDIHAIRRRLPVVLLAVVLGAFAVWLGPRLLDGGSHDALIDALSRRGRVASAAPSLAATALPGTRLVEVDEVGAVASALQGDDGHALARALRAESFTGVLLDVEGHRGGVAARLCAYERVDGMRGLYLGSAQVLYAPESLDDLSQAHREALVTVARRLLEGSRPPRITSFPEPLRRVRHVEVMVLLRQGTRPRLWRSARGSSIGRALVTAATVARERWHERQAAMGGPLDGVLDRLTVEVALLADDGTIGERDPAFVDRVVTDKHGVAYERKGAWRYLLPRATATRGGGHPSAALEGLFEDNGLDRASLGKADLRPYRLSVTTLAVSSPLDEAGGEPGSPAGGGVVDGGAPQPADALGDVAHPDEVLDE